MTVPSELHSSEEAHPASAGACSRTSGRARYCTASVDDKPSDGGIQKASDAWYGPRRAYTQGSPLLDDTARGRETKGRGPGELEQCPAPGAADMIRCGWCMVWNGHVRNTPCGENVVSRRRVARTTTDGYKRGEEEMLSLHVLT